MSETIPQFPAGGGDAPPVAVAYGAQMKKRNIIAVWLGLPIITLGIYRFVWYFKIHKEMKAFDERQPIKPGGSLCTLIFGSLLIIPPFVSIFNTGKRIANAQRAAGLEPTCSGGIGLLLMFVAGLGTLYYQMELNKVVDRYGAAEGTQVPLVA